MRPLLLALALLATAPAAGMPFVSDDLRAPAPGPDWVMQVGVPGSPQLAGAFLLERDKTGSLITFGIDAKPDLTDPPSYLARDFRTLSAPPISFHPGATTRFRWKGGDAARIEYIDQDGARHGAMVAARTPRGGMLIVNLQSPDAAAYHDDLTVFVKFLDGIELPVPKKKK